MRTEAARGRDLIDNRKVLAAIDDEQPFARKLWGLLSLELWQRAFHDREAQFKGLLSEPPAEVAEVRRLPAAGSG